MVVFLVYVSGLTVSFSVIFWPLPCFIVRTVLRPGLIFMVLVVVTVSFVFFVANIREDEPRSFGLFWSLKAHRFERRLSSAHPVCAMRGELCSDRFL